MKKNNTAGAPADDFQNVDVVGAIVVPIAPPVNSLTDLAAFLVVLKAPDLIGRFRLVVTSTFGLAIGRVGVMDCDRNTADCALAFYEAAKLHNMNVFLRAVTPPEVAAKLPPPETEEPLKLAMGRMSVRSGPVLAFLTQFLYFSTGQNDNGRTNVFTNITPEPNG